MNLKYTLKRFTKYAIIRAGLEAASLVSSPSISRSSRGRGLIFTLHHVRPDEGEPYAPNAVLSVTPTFLEEAIQVALECGLTPVPLEALPTLLADPDDHRSFVSFTLDDGYRNNATYAAPVFRKYNVPYTIFITEGFVERTRTMWWETVEVLTRKTESLAFDLGSGTETLRHGSLADKSAAFDRLAAFVHSIDEDDAVERIDNLARRHSVNPMEIVDRLTMNESELRALASDPLVRFGAHTATHVNLKRVSDERLHREIAQSARAVERYVGRLPREFAYPYGYRSAVGPREVDATARHGFSVAVTTQPGVLTAERLSHPTGLNRVSLNGYYQRRRHVRTLISGIPFRFL